MTTTDPLPPEALTWLAVWPGVRGLTFGGSLLPQRLEEAGHTVFAMADTDRDMRRLLALQGITPFWARPEAIPIDPCQFDVVFSHQSFHLFDPGQALSEIARVLRPGGCFSASYIIRDDSVPWVRRLTALLRHYDPMAMRGDYGHASLAAVDDSKYFPEVEHRAFRIWQTVSLDDLQQLVRPGENLRLPFQLLAWRAWVNHDELTEPVSMPESGIEIDMQVATPLR